MPDLMRRINTGGAVEPADPGFNPAAVCAEDYQEVPVAIDLGHLPQHGAFLDRVSPHVPAREFMSDLKIKSQQSQTLNNTIAVRATATTYVYLESAVPPPERATPAAGTRRAR